MVGDFAKLYIWSDGYAFTVQMEICFLVSEPFPPWKEN